MKMERLWAPWRTKYIQKINKGRKCIFCKANKDKDDKRNFLLLRSSYSLAILNIFPYNNGHIMVAPKRHIGNLEGLSQKELLDLINIVRKITKLLKKIVKPDGFNIGLNIGKGAGAGITNHLHIHIVPRWLEDTNFMPICSNTKVISQSLNELYMMIKKYLKEKEDL
jgi:ATP adenylyltransferase